MKLLVDENLSPRLARGLAELFRGDHYVVHLRDKFEGSGIADEAWIRALGHESGWCVLSGDINIAKRRPSKAIFLAEGLIGFFPLKAVLDLPTHRLAARVLVMWNAMERIASSTTSGCYTLGITGTKLHAI